MPFFKNKRNQPIKDDAMKKSDTPDVANVTELISIKEVKETSRTEFISSKGEKETGRTEFISNKEGKETGRTEFISNKGEKETSRTEFISNKGEKETSRTEFISSKSDKETGRTEFISSKGEKETDRTEFISNKEGKETSRTEFISNKGDKETDRTEFILNKEGKETSRTEFISSKGDKETGRTEFISNKGEKETGRTELVPDKMEEELISYQKDEIKKNDEGVSKLKEKKSEAEIIQIDIMKTNAVALDAGTSFILRLVDKENGGKAFERIVHDTLVIGRKNELCDLAISYDKTVSSRQCRVYIKNRKLYVTDLGGTNITYLNDKPVKEDLPLVTGDVLGFGRLNLRVTVTKNS
jgi:hypothetical protein